MYLTFRTSTLVALLLCTVRQLPGQSQEIGRSNPLDEVNLNTVLNVYHEEGLLGKNLGYYQGYRIVASGANEDLDKQDRFESGNLDHRYIIFPDLQMVDIRTPASNALGEGKLRMQISASYPDRENVARFLQNTTPDKLVHASDVEYLTVFGLVLTDQYDGTVLRSRVQQQLAPSQRALNLTATYPDLQAAQRAYDRIQGGESLDLVLLLNRRYLQGECEFSISGSDILQSKAYRDFVSPIQGEVITVDQAEFLSERIAQELTNKFQCKGNTPLFMESLAHDVFQSLFTERRVLSFEDLSARNYLIDLDGERYSPSVFKRFLNSIVDEGSSSSSSNSANESRYIYDKKKRMIVDTKAGGGMLFGLLKGDAKVKMDNDRSVRRDDFSKSSQSESHSTQHKNNVVLEFEGDVVVPRGIITHEVIDVDISQETDFSGEFSKYVQGFEPFSCQIYLR